MPVRHPVVPRLLEQRVEPAQIPPEPVGGHRGVLPAGLRRTVQAPRGEPGAVLPDPPQRRHLGGRGDQAYVDRVGLRGNGGRPGPGPPSGAPAATAAAADRASSAVPPVTSANSQPAPCGRSGTAPRPRTTSTILASSPSQATSRWCSSDGTASAASNIVG